MSTLRLAGAREVDIGVHGLDVTERTIAFARFLREKQPYLDLLLLPATAFVPWLVLRKRTGFGFAEQVMTAAMIGTGAAVVGLLFTPAIFLLKSYPLALKCVRIAALPLVYGYTAWAYADLQKDDRPENAMGTARRYGRALGATVGAKLGGVLLIFALGFPLIYAGTLLKLLASLIRE